jgi:hypothetical protein
MHHHLAPPARLQHSTTCASQAVVTSLLADPKVEVRHLAAATLSGMLKGMHDADREALEAQLLNRAGQLFPTGRKRIKAAAGTAGAQVGGRGRRSRGRRLLPQLHSRPQDAAGGAGAPSAAQPPLRHTSPALSRATCTHASAHASRAPPLLPLRSRPSLRWWSGWRACTASRPS